MRFSSKHLGWLLLLASCGQQEPAEQRHIASPPPASTVRHTASAPLVQPAAAYTSGDRETTGPRDTLHVGQGLVLRLVPGSKRDFLPVPQYYAAFSEARLIRQEGDGRVRRVGHTLIMRPFHGPVLRFIDNTYRMRHDHSEELDYQCRFLGSTIGRPYWLADSALWERAQPFLIHKQSGRITPLPVDSEPVISPDRQLLLIASPGLDGPIPYNALALWHITDKTVARLWTRELAHWQPQRVRWLDNHAIAIEQLRFEPRQDTTYVRLLLP